MTINLSADQVVLLQAGAVTLLLALLGLAVVVVRSRSQIITGQTDLQKVKLKSEADRIENQTRLDKMQTDHTLQLKETNDRLTAINDKLQQVIVDTTSEISILKGRMIEKEKVELALSERVQRMSERNVELSKRYDEIEKERDDAVNADSASREALQKANMTILNIQADVEKFKLEAGRLQDELDKTNRRVEKLEGDLEDQIKRSDEYRIIISHMRYALRTLTTLVPVLPEDIQRDFAERGIDLKALSGDPLAAPDSKISTATLRAVADTPPVGTVVVSTIGLQGG